MYPKLRTPTIHFANPPSNIPPLYQLTDLCDMPFSESFAVDGENSVANLQRWLPRGICNEVRRVDLNPKSPLQRVKVNLMVRNKCQNRN